MMRSGKRGDPGIPDTEDWNWTPEEAFVSAVAMDPGIEEESADLGIDLEALDNSKLRRITRSGAPRDQWGGVHMLRTGKRSNQAAGSRQIWAKNFLRSLRNRSGDGRRSRFGGGHMMRSGKRSSWGPSGPEGDDLIQRMMMIWS